MGDVASVNAMHDAVSGHDGNTPTTTGTTTFTKQAATAFVEVEATGAGGVSMMWHKLGDVMLVNYQALDSAAAQRIMSLDSPCGFDVP